MRSHHLHVSPRGDSPTILEVLGPNFLGVIVNYLLWGVQIVQSYYYYKTFRKKDPIGLKIAVALLFISDTVQSIDTAHIVWEFMISNYGDLKGAQSSQLWSLNVLSMLDAFTASIVHIVYAHKIWTLLRPPYKYIFTALVILLSSTQLVAGLGSTIHAFVAEGNLSAFTEAYVWDSTWLIAASMTDIIILLVMARTLSTSRTGHKRTDDVITKLVLFIVETNFATSVVQIVDAVLFLKSPTTPLFAFCSFIAPKVYSISMLVLLNSREQRVSELQSVNSEPKNTNPTALVFGANSELRSRGVEQKSSHTMSNETSIPGDEA